jgi:hypothetical protein
MGFRMTNTPQDRLRDARLKAGYETAADAARAFGWKDVTYRAHESQGRGIEKSLEKYAKAFGVAPGWLRYGKGPRESVSGIDPDKVLVAFEVLLGIASRNNPAAPHFAKVVLQSLEGPIEPPTGVPPLTHLRSALHERCLQFVRQAGEKSGQ